MNKPQKHFPYVNIVQFLVLGILTLIILVDKTPVVIDHLVHRDNLRLVTAGVTENAEEYDYRSWVGATPGMLLR